MNKQIVNIILILFKETDFQLLKECCIGLKNQSHPCYITVILDPQTSDKEVEFVEQFEFDEYIQSPAELSTFPALRHKWAFDRSSFKYVAFQQGDDQPYLSRIERQLTVLQTSKKNPAICFGGFHYVINKDLQQYNPSKFRYVDKHLFNVGYPSFWLIDKSKIKELPLIEGFQAPNEWEWDLFMLIEILKQHESIVMEEAVGVYNQHLKNSTNTHCTKESQRNNYEKLCEFFEKNKKIKNIYEVTRLGFRSDNK